ncbi:MAG TPA: type II toxin-antitoxin system RelE/ParE family toxin [Kiritimatiellia bacterium]|nr:type II toxin-antitoxin system RelE/ParE family toxin [Kiritimatiellia bacterium]HMO99551.1 type II toxin-antitoxin system RelE/ParE family toxin [Kiritimatiellia bacterium]
MARLIWTEPALTDLEVIAEYIALDNPDAAKTLVRKVFDTVDRLVHFPDSGSKPPEIKRLPYRQVIVSPCRIFYRAAADNIYIVLVMRGEQDLNIAELTTRE